VKPGDVLIRISAGGYFDLGQGKELSLAARRFPPPWSVEEYNDACFIVRDHNGPGLAYVSISRMSRGDDR
jgi:hypothetical protein